MKKINKYFSIEDQDENIFVVSTYASVHKLEEYYLNFDLVILDECHHALSPTTLFL